MSVDRGRMDLRARPAVVMVVGVNGTGKTTTIGKLAAILREELGLSVVLAAADTYRAAAIEQLEAWARRAEAEIVRGSPGGDPGAVVFDAIEAAEARGADVVIADTAGRLHTHGNLMEELAKVRGSRRSGSRARRTRPLIVIDATTGQNGLRQAQAFAEAVDVTGVVITKLDGTAKGGIAVAIANELELPVRMVGWGRGSTIFARSTPAPSRAPCSGTSRWPEPGASKLTCRCSTSSQTACRRRCRASARAES